MGDNKRINICKTDSEKMYPCDIVVLAMGFLGPEKAIIESLSLNQDPRSNIETSSGSYATNVPHVYAAGGGWHSTEQFANLLTIKICWLNIKTMWNYQK